ncbi:MAG: hypothetical protein J6W38_10060 [Prevotella sp.]|nr:hypothetical protein [Prevotella sp.]
MIKASNIVRWLWSSLMLMGLLMLVSCTEDSSNDVPQRVSLHLLSVTRTGDGHNHLQEGKIRLFITTDNSTTSQSGSFDWTTTWEKDADNPVSIKENTQYYIYGYWPNDNSIVSSSSGITATSSDLNGDYSKGADLTMSGLPVFSNEDILVIVGVQKVVQDNQVIDDPHIVATQGNYGYFSGLADDNYVNLLMDHLYSQLSLQFCVDKNYYALRRIHLKTVTLKTTYVAKGEKVTATVNLRAGEGLTDRVSFPPAPTSVPAEPETYKLLKEGDSDLGTKDYIDLTSEEASSLTVLSNTVYCPYSIFDTEGTHVSIECTYEVWTPPTTEYPDGMRVRENCSATNKLKIPGGMSQGMNKTLKLTIAPTYLYVLADPDLDNPTIKIN